MRNAVIVFLIKDEQVLLLHSYQIPKRDSMYWQGISGFTEESEEPRLAAIREAEEELEVRIKPEELHHTHTFESDDIKFFVFTTNTWERAPVLNEVGLEEMRWFPINKLPFEGMRKSDTNWLPAALS